MTFNGNTLTYEVRDRRAYLTLDRPERLNAITAEMAQEINGAVAAANADDSVRAIVLQSAGRAFCAGYDLKVYAEGGQDHQKTVWDPIQGIRMMKANTDHFFSLWRSAKPTVAMWVYRLDAERAKRMLLTGDTIDGVQAKEWGLVIDAVPADELDAAVEKLVDRMASVPTNQLVMHKMMVNQATTTWACRAPRTWPCCSTGSPATPPRAAGSSTSPRSTASAPPSSGATAAG